MNIFRNHGRHAQKQKKKKIEEENEAEKNEGTGEARYTYPTLAATLKEFEDCADLAHHSYPRKKIDILYFGHLADNDELDRFVSQPFTSVAEADVSYILERQEYEQVTQEQEVFKAILKGKVAIFYQKDVFVVDVYGPEGRNIAETETETVITGPHDGFVEALGTNVSLIRRRLQNSHLKAIKLKVGELGNQEVLLLYIKGIVPEEMVNQLVHRVEGIEVDGVLDSNMLVQMIDENPYSVFPQYLTTERPDLAVSKLLSGKIVGLLDNSPSAFCAPTNFFDFFSSPDDYYQRWPLGSFIRLLRFVAFIITCTFTALYVAVTTYHYEMVPEALLVTLAESRTRVPFDPLYEALFLEITIEFLREAGARLPTKIGQTIGIVGGIVIGQAAVQAGFTSNILIIAVAISALASFVIPSYVMSASIRLLRFFFILLAGILGNFGLLFGVTLVIIHLSAIQNLGTPYLIPLSPLYIKDWKDIFIRAPLSFLTNRPVQTQSSNVIKSKKKG